jgi:hypothetical protein
MLLHRMLHKRVTTEDSSNSGSKLSTGKVAEGEITIFKEACVYKAVSLVVA